MNWISVMDKLPEEREEFGNTSDKVIVSYIDSENENFVSTGYTFYYEDIRYWNVDDESSVKTNWVTHWMPLPEPPKM